MCRSDSEVHQSDMSNGLDEQHDVPTVAENEQVQAEQPTSMVTDEEAAANGATVRLMIM